MFSFRIMKISSPKNPKKKAKTMPKKITFKFDFCADDEDLIMASVNLKDEKQALRVKDQIQSLAGSLLELDGSFLYAIFPAEQESEVAKELSRDGFAVDASETYFQG